MSTTAAADFVHDCGILPANRDSRQGQPREGLLQSRPRVSEIEPIIAAIEKMAVSSLVEHQESVQCTELVEVVSDGLARHSREFVALLDGKRYVGAISRGQLGFALGKRFGFALFAGKQIGQLLLPDFLAVEDQTSLLSLLNLALERRGEGFHHDVAIVDDQQRFIGFISVQTLVRLQTRLMAEKTLLVESANRRLSQEVLDRTRAEEALKSEILQRHEAQERTKHSESRLAQAQEIARIGNWEWDLIQNSVIWSDEHYRIFGLEPGEYSPEFDFFHNLAHPEDRESVEEWINLVLTGRQPAGIEYRAVQPTGEVCFVQSRAEIVLDASGNPLRMIGTSQDVTERKRAELELENLNRQLVDASRQAGMAEIATGVLHNVGNVLNSVNVSAALIAESVKTFQLSHLAGIVTVLREHEHELGTFVTNDPRGRQLPNYLEQLSENFRIDGEKAVNELASLQKNIEHVKQIVAMQQNYARVSGVREAVNISELMEDSLRMNDGALTRHHVEVLRHYEKVPPIHAEKHKVLQILVNLVRNAKHACDGSGRTDKRIIVSVGKGESGICVTIADNGIGILRENLTRIFAHGFTTKTDGHGFGLHSSALTAIEMGGSLTAFSEGLGHGAVFTLMLPLCISGERTGP